MDIINIKQHLTHFYPKYTCGSGLDVFTVVDGVWLDTLQL